MLQILLLLLLNGLPPGISSHNQNQVISPVSRIMNNKIACLKANKIFLKGKEFRIAGLNVYDLAYVAARSQPELEATLKAVAESGANTIRFWAFSIHKPEIFLKIFDTTKKLNLDLKFIPVFGNNWQDMESPGSHFLKDDQWYSEGYKKEYLPHVLGTVRELRQRDEILMLELMNEPEADYSVLRKFADTVSTKIREVYNTQTGKRIPRHLISLGLLGGEKKDWPNKKEYMELFDLPNIDLVTAHDYTLDWGLSGEADLSPVFVKYTDYARALNKPFFLGEIGVKIRPGGTETQPNGPDIRTLDQALKIYRKKLELYKRLNISGALLWGPQPLGHAVDGAGFGFSFKPGDNTTKELQEIFAVFKK
jgi:hypothetical protein